VQYNYLKEVLICKGNLLTKQQHLVSFVYLFIYFYFTFFWWKEEPILIWLE